jgi:L-proline amide hydrolase
VVQDGRRPEVVIYGQLGGGQSTHLQDKPKFFKLWTVDIFMNELDAVLEHSGIEDDFDLGHSWGGMLVAEYVVKKAPAGLKSSGPRQLARVYGPL